MDQKTIFLTMIGMGLVTYIPRLLPVWFLSSRSLPQEFVTWLRYVPVAVLAAMLLPSLLVQESQVSLGLDNIFLWAAIPTFLVVWKTRSMFAAVLVGMIIVAAARALL